MIQLPLWTFSLDLEHLEDRDQLAEGIALLYIALHCITRVMTRTYRRAATSHKSNSAVA